MSDISQQGARRVPWPPQRVPVQGVAEVLSQAGFVQTTLGPSGGYRLARLPAELTFLDIVEAVEGKARTFVCNNIRANNPCRPPGYCETGALRRGANHVGGR